MAKAFRDIEARQRHRDGSSAGGRESAARRRAEAELGLAYARGWRAGFKAAAAIAAAEQPGD